MKIREKKVSKEPKDILEDLQSATEQYFLLLQKDFLRTKVLLHLKTSTDLLNLERRAIKMTLAIMHMIYKGG